MPAASTSLYTVLAAYAGLTALIGEGDAFRFWPVEARQNALKPCLVYQQIATNPSNTHGSGAPRLDQVRFQLTALADTQEEAEDVITQARQAIEANAGLKASFIDERAIARAENAQTYGQAADFLIWNDPDA